MSFLHCQPLNGKDVAIEAVYVCLSAELFDVWLYIYI